MTTRVLAFPFAFDTPNLLTGHPVYVPKIGDILLDAWIEVNTAWDGTTPKGDVSSFVAQGTGWFGILFSPIAMGLVDDDELGGGNLLSQASSSASSSALSDLDITLTGGPAIKSTRFVPAKFSAADPIKIVVSQDGTNTGADPVSTQGSAILYLAVATITVVTESAADQAQAIKDGMVGP